MPKDEDVTQKEKAPKWFMFFTIVGVLNGLMYTYVLVGILIDLLNNLGILLNISNTYMGLTILAVGNALPDALTTISLCKDPARATLAISGGYAGQLFGLLIGFGLSQLKQTIIKGPQTFDLFNPAKINDNLLDIMVIGTAFIVLVYTFIFGVVNKFRMTKGFGYVLIAMYIAFFIGATVIAVISAVKTY